MSGKPRKRKPRPHKAQKKQPQATPRPPVVPPSDPSHPPDTQEIQSPSRDGGIDQQNDKKVAKMDWSVIVNIVFAGLVAAATIGLVVVGAYQLNAIRSQIRQTQQTLDMMKQQQRGRLFVPLPNLGKAQIGPACDYTLQNCGGTPIVIESIEAIFFTPKENSRKEVLARPLINRDVDRRVMIPPGGKEPFREIADMQLKEQVPTSDIKYFRAKIVYSDIFGGTHDGEYLFRINKSTGEVQRASFGNTTE